MQILRVDGLQYMYQFLICLNVKIYIPLKRVDSDLVRLKYRPAVNALVIGRIVQFCLTAVCNAERSVQASPGTNSHHNAGNIFLVLISYTNTKS